MNFIAVEVFIYVDLYFIIKNLLREEVSTFAFFQMIYTPFDS